MDDGSNESVVKMAENCIETGKKRAITSSLVCHTVRTRDNGKKTLKYGRKQAIHLFCTECLGWGDHPKNCTSKLYPLFPFRGITQASNHGDKE